MKIVERRKVILGFLQEHESMEINDIAKRLNVSSMTIRRDLKELTENGSVSIKQGVVVLNEGSLREYDMILKHDINVGQKRAIAKQCLDHINEGDSIFLDAGTTVKELAHLLDRRRNINVLTHSLLAANAIAGARGLRTIMCPGEYREMSMAFMGPLTDDFIKGFQIDTLFLSVEGVSLENGVSVIDVLDGHSKRALIDQAKHVILMADSSKFGKSYFYKIAALSEIDRIVTDGNLDDAIYDEYIQNGIDIERVDC